MGRRKESVVDIGQKQAVFDSYIDKIVRTKPGATMPLGRFQLHVCGKNLDWAREKIHLYWANHEKVKFKFTAIEKTFLVSNFYDGDIQSCVVVFSYGLFACLRINHDIYYYEVEADDRRTVLDVGRKHKMLFDLRSLDADDLKRYGDNIYAFSF